MGRGGTPARETSFVSLVAYGPNSDSALTMRGYSLWNQAGRFPTTLKRLWECLTPRTVKSEKVACELPLIGSLQGQHNSWTEGIGLAQKGTGDPAANCRTGLEVGQLWWVRPRPGHHPRKTIGREKSETQLPQPAAARKNSRNCLACLKSAAGFCFSLYFFFFSCFNLLFFPQVRQ